MPRSLKWQMSPRTSSLETFFAHFSSVMKLHCKCQQLSAEEVFRDISSWNLAASPRSEQDTFPCRRGERWRRKSHLQETAGSSRSEDEKEKWAQPDSWRWQLGYLPDGWETPIPVALVMYSTPSPSTLDQTSLSWHAAGRSAFNFYSPAGNTATAKDESEVQDEAISLWTHETQKVCLDSRCNEYCLFRSYTTELFTHRQRAEFFWLRN